MMPKTFMEKIHEILLADPNNKAQLIKVIHTAQQKDIIDTDALLMIEGVLNLGDLKVRDIMLSRTRMISLHEDQTLAEIIDVVTQSGHSRFPVTDEEQTTVLGILHAKDLLSYFKHNPDTVFNIRDILKPVIFIPESKEVNRLLKDFRVNRYHMAIIVDEYGKPAGFITIEDILEEIVGNIEDEFDPDPDLFIKEKSKDHYLVKGATPIEEFNEYFSCELDDSEFDTVGGMITQLFGHLPKMGEEITLADQFNIKVIESDQRRLELVELACKPNVIETSEKQAVS